MTLTYLDLTEHQRAALNDLPFDGNHLVSGAPGSGKSLLAVQRAVMQALTGGPTVLLTRSNLLRQSIAPMVSALGPSQDRVEVATAHAWLAAWYREQTGSDAPRSEDGWYDWGAFVRAATLIEPVPGLSVVVDEGQDLPPEFYRFCRVLEARITVYADECQQLTDTHSTLAEIAKALGGCPVREIEGNHRNTRQVAELARHFHVGQSNPEPPERSGPPARLHAFARPGDLRDLLVGLAQLHPQRSIGVILKSTRSQLALMTQLDRVAPRVKTQMYTAEAEHGRYRNLALARPGIVLVNRASAKGLGFDVVVVPDTHADAGTDPTSASLRMAYYVLATRARHELHFGYEGESEPPLIAQIPRQDLARG
ncbi:DNA helicase [Streptomyces sp. NPDC056525]|uniref:DNA helicase n=1 Tax=unclassified Streptomyces TaxID=2593676 RepID=UPI00368EF209